MNRYHYDHLSKCFILIFGMIFINNAYAEYWKPIDLPTSYFYPCTNPPCGNRETNVYSMQFPTAKQAWFAEPDCGPNVQRSTSSRWVSNQLNNILGLQFKGLVYKYKGTTSRYHTPAHAHNEFAVFFHEKKCYDGGPEYGWVFREDNDEAKFYICGDCNLNNQKWCDWPDGDCKVISGDEQGVKEAFKKPSTYKYWSIKVTPEGNFMLEVLDPNTWNSKSCLIQKPDWLPNMYNRTGYITINGQKRWKLINLHLSYILMK